jgi:Zn-dependent membrane protease YugP
MFLFYNPFYLLILLPGILLGIIAQARVSSTFHKYSRVRSKRNVTAHDLSGMLLERNGCAGVRIRPIRGHLTDHYDPRDYTLNLSESVCYCDSVAALGVAAHEVGHAVQHAENYFPLKLRSAMVKITNLGTMLAIPLVLIGVLIEWFALSAESAGMTTFAELLILVGIFGYGLTTLFSLVTLPVEFNASRRALAMIKEVGALDKEELRGARTVLSAAAWTYIASFVTSLLYFLRFLMIISSMRGRRD